MKKFISLVIVSLLAISMLVGCTQTPESGGASSTTNSTSDTGNTMTFYNGEKELPTDFDNFVVIDYTLIDQFVSLEIVPTYANTGSPAETRYYTDWTRIFHSIDLNDITRVDTRSETYFEEVLALKPDFIVIPESYERDLGKYEAIAPTYVFPEITEAPEGSALWKEELKYVAQFVGKTEMGEELIATYDQLVVDSRDLVADEIEGKTALVLQLNDKGFKIRMPETQASVYADLGFGVPEGLDSSFESTSVSNEDGSFPVEQIVEFNPDYIFVQLQSADSYNALVGTPIWEGIQAVKDGRVYETTQSGWNHLNGYLANTHRLNELVYFITEDKQTMPEYAILD